MKTWIYSWLVYPLALCVGFLLGVFRPKVRRTLRLRSWKQHLSLRFHANNPIEYWVHVASAGELEYAIPILQELNAIKKKVLVTYYSISAQSAVEALPRRFDCVALTVPLPHDGLGLMKEFVGLVYRQGVRKLLLLKYEMWPGLLWECNAIGIQVILTEALRPSWFHKKLIHKLSALLAGYESELKNIAHPNCHVVGDTRVERVLERLNAPELSIVTRFKELLLGRDVLVCGSIWPEDQAVLAGSLRKLNSEGRPHVVWLAHELDRKQASSAERDFKAIGYDTLWVERESDLAKVRLSDRPAAFIVFKKGILVELYKLGQKAYVGGGFVADVHNVWEPALAGCVVACGPKVKRSPESFELRNGGLLTILDGVESMIKWFCKEMRVDPSTKQQRNDTLKQIVSKHVGAAKQIVAFCEQRDGG